MNTRKRNADTQESAWLADEDAFVLRQAYKKAQIRVQEGRANPVDWLAVTLQFVDDTRNPFDNESLEADVELTDPVNLIDDLDYDELKELRKDMDIYSSLERAETKTIKRDFWRAARSVCDDRLQHRDRTGHTSRGAQDVSADVGKIFKSKSYQELVALEQQINTKLTSDQPIDTDYWQSLRSGVTLYKSRAKLKTVTEEALTSQKQKLCQQQADAARRSLSMLSDQPQNDGHEATALLAGANSEDDPESLLKVPQSCKGLPIVEEADWLRQVANQRDNITRTGYVPRKSRKSVAQYNESMRNSQVPAKSSANGASQTVEDLLEQRIRQQLGEDEEPFAEEAEVPVSTGLPGRVRPRYLNLVTMGYEWNKYNQTHYDQENPPPKVVQGYKFNIFYPHLEDKSRGPTFKMIREQGRRRGQLAARAGEEDMCTIKFIASAPYDDIAFRVIDREWDYSARRERGFKSTFESGVLQLHFQFRRMFYRK